MSYVKALIGYTGFVGSNLLRQTHFDALYNSQNIEHIKQENRVDLIVCAAPGGVKWLANRAAEEDSRSVERLISSLEGVKTTKFVLISTIDVYPNPYCVDEDSLIRMEDLLPYGRNRRRLEVFVEHNFETTIVRLPGLFGRNIKKNIIYDLLNKSYEYINQDGIYQLYGLESLWDDIELTLINNLKVLNIATQPISVKELAAKIFGVSIHSTIHGKVPYYDMHTKYASIWGEESPYLYSKSKILEELKIFVQNYRKSL